MTDWLSGFNLYIQFYSQLPVYSVLLSAAYIFSSTVSCLYIQFYSQLPINSILISATYIFNSDISYPYIFNSNISYPYIFNSANSILPTTRYCLIDMMYRYIILVLLWLFEVHHFFHYAISTPACTPQHLLTYFNIFNMDLEIAKKLPQPSRAWRLSFRMWSFWRFPHNLIFDWFLTCLSSWSFEGHFYFTFY